LFLVVIQSGAVAAVALIYKERLFDLLAHYSKPESLDYLLKLGTAFVSSGVQPR
jgi:undecaprenyl-diphosphatase